MALFGLTTLSSWKHSVLLALLSLLILHKAALPALAQYGEDDDYPAFDEDDYDDEADDAEDDKDVIILTEDNFATVIEKAPFVLVEFYAPWCGHCKQLAPEYAQAATEIKEYDETIVIAKLDATVHGEVAQQFDVEGYPTLKWFKNGEVSEYDGGRTAADIVAWVKRKTGPASRLVEFVADLEKYTKDEEVVVLAYLSGLEGAEFDAYMAVAGDNADVVFVHTVTAEVAAVHALKVSSAIMLKEFDGGNVPLEGALEEEAFGAFVGKNKLPLVIPFNEKNADRIFGSGIASQVLLFYSGDDAEEVLSTARAVAPQFTGECIFVSVDTDTEEVQSVLEYFGVEAGKVEPVQLMGFVVKDEEGIKYEYTDEYTVEAVVAYTKKLVAGELTPYFKSEDIPEKNDGPVLTVVGKTFDAVVNDATKDVMLEIYAPWCGHCKQLAPIYKKLGKRFKDVESVVIAQMDGTANEHPSLTTVVEGFPTVLFYPAQHKEDGPLKVEGERTLKELAKFIKENADIPYEIPSKKKETKDEL
uniref:Protein disulfide-isomerase n=1 Tax=Pyramimonas obovata TaxID=1411642 RepID=A0A7S0QTJ9_9CHLO|mmetsp:Transcript_11029/g.22987  ORF Transcript_11029/g.22987 Transcript_11029/m.22987 type:complete len:529 (+) Transcript_11029:101-1687(+)|eukprot:CAMPEP_0118932180 /NCGR_PEP_ID=MMETSP1169-20130426/9389_1 /TAXON_ID=36882 /ORGANISM="Pyramimonas obovata, Strain CCMP722" /LENGTH=528 /DNA_ID=CAMNT_0006874797 /DNA_START=101 /DNA_END=1687 /DNA_ORIENTATION=-